MSRHLLTVALLLLALPHEARGQSPPPAAIPAEAAPPEVRSVDLSWLSIANMYFEIGDFAVLADGYITRIPQAAFYGGGGGLAFTRGRYTPDVAEVSRVLGALGGPGSVDLLITGHSHFDHSFDTATWSRLTAARILGPRTTCLQARAEGIPGDRCTAVVGGEKVPLTSNATMWVIRWNHSGTSTGNPEQHDPVELHDLPVADPAEPGFRAGVAEDFPNGGGGRAFLFRVDTPEGPLSWFYQNSASPTDLHLPIVVDGIDYGAPLDNLRRAMVDAGLESVDLWIGTGGAAVARLVVPIVKPVSHLQVHWDGLYSPFSAGMPMPFSNRGLEDYLAASGVELLRPGQYMDRWRIDTAGVRAVPNDAVKAALQLPAFQPFPR